MSGEADHWPMGVLGLDEDECNAKTIRRAYARKLKQLDQAADPEGFQRLREAFEQAKRIAQWAIEDAAAEEEFRQQEEAEQAAGETQEDAAPKAPPLDQIGVDVAEDAPTDPELAQDQELPELREWDDFADQDEFWEDPAPQGSEEEQALRVKISELLDAKAAPWDWKAVLDDPVLFDIDAAQRIENQIFHGLRERLIRHENHAPQRPAFANRAWVEMIDERFGWTSDFPMFQRKFGWFAEEMLLVLAPVTSRGGQLRGPGQPAAEYVDRRIELGRRPWLWTAGMLCAGYFAMRVFLLDLVLP